MSIIIIDSEVTRWLSTDRNTKLQSLFNKIGIAGENTMKTKAPIGATSKLHNSISYKTLGAGNLLQTRIQAKISYSLIALETGRKPGKAAPVAALRRWVKSKGMRPGAEFAIARKIGKQGTQKFQKGGPKVVTETFNELKGNIIPEIVNDITDIFIKP